ncbi:MAG: hypothetical protein AAGD25_38185 [Cyanobacteria bacterium P01_F01_bin.150]
MTEITINSELLKDVIKSAILELLQDNKDEVHQLFSEIIEDIAMEKAIEEGQDTELVSRDEIFSLLAPKS